MSIVINNLVKIYGTQNAVDNISFSVKKGEVIGFLGPNGAGKSTTMKIATCFLPPTSGHVEVCGFDVQKNPLEVKSKVGYLPESNPLYYEMYVKEYLGYIGRIYGLRGEKLESRIKEMVETTGLGLEQKKKIGQLSKGYKQRVGLAQALIHDPEVLILDEPTNGFDPNQLVEIRKLIKDVSKEKTVILSTHIMQEVQLLCERVVIINSGKIVADNQIDKLTSSSLVNQYNVKVQFSGKIEVDLLHNIPDVDSVTEKSEGKYEIISNSRDLRHDIFKLAALHNWALLEMKLEEGSLEKVFQSLTKPDSGK